MNIFISYRRHDTAGEAGRLVDSLKQHFREDEIFIDIDTIQPGLDFSEVIESSLNTCDVLLAVIGPEWLNSALPNGNRRLDNPDDFIRMEIAEALRRKIRVIPVLVDGASLPESTQLPDDLKGLVRRQAYEVSNKRWKFDVDELVKSLKKGASSSKTLQDNTPDPITYPAVEPLYITEPTAVQSPVFTQAQPNYSSPQPGNVLASKPPKNWLIESILATLFCCLPFGIAGIVNAAKVNDLYKSGDYAGAQNASHNAAKWTRISFFIGLSVYILWIIYYALVLGGAGEY